MRGIEYVGTKMGALAAVVGALLVAGCGATAPTQELQDARAVYQEAQSGLTAEVNPDELHQASEALARAEAAHEEDPGSEREQDLAYIADRRIRVAMAHARAEHAQQERERQEQEYQQQLEQRVEVQEEALEATAEELEDARQAQREAEERAERAQEMLNEFATVERQQDRTLITLNGEVLFELGEASLLPTAQRRLGQVAEALRDDQGQAAQIVIEGHTDSQGPEDFNRQLSEQRAQRVMEFLSSQGLDTERMRAVGRGETEPVASNRTPEGRANNRRVEIAVLDEGGQASPAESPTEGTSAAPDQSDERDRGPRAAAN